MAVFPALRPGTRTFIAASYPGAVHTAYGGQESRVRTSNASSGARLRMQFPGISEAQMLEIASHYAGQRGRFYPFQLSDEALSGVTDPDALTPAGYQWIYAGSPKITDISIGTAAAPSCVHDVELELELVPEVSTFAGGARWTATAAIRSGIAIGGDINLAGASWSAAAAIGGGIAIYDRSASGAAWTATAAIAGGAATDGNIALSGASWSAAAAISGGGIVLDGNATGATWSAAATVAGGAGDGGAATDPNFSDVSLLLHMNGSNGSTTFTDNSSSTRTVTVYGNAQISTARSQFGGASGLFDGTGDYLGVAITGGLGSGDFTVEFWYYKTADTGMIFNCRTSGTSADGFDVTTLLGATTSSNILVSNATPSSNTWIHVAFVRSGGTFTRYINGTANGTKSWSSNLTGTSFSIGGIPAGTTGYLTGNIDEFRITKAARYTANFTPPTAAFPDS